MRNENERKYNRNKLFILSLILIIIGAGLTTFIPYLLYLYFFPFIIFLIGVILLWFTDRKIKIKILYTIIPILFFFTYQYLWKIYNTTEPETFLIPENYRGQVFIMFNEKCGNEIKYEEDRRVYEIPNDGILMTKFEDEQGFINQEFYLVDKNGKRKKIEQLDVRDFNEEWTTEKNPNEPPRTKLGIFHAGRTYSNGNSGFYISTYKDLDSRFGFKYEQKFDSIMTMKISNCK